MHAVCVIFFEWHVQDLSTETAVATVSAYASFSDGTSQEVTTLPGLQVSSLAPTYLSISGSQSNITVSMRPKLGPKPAQSMGGRRFSIMKCVLLLQALQSCMITLAEAAVVH